MVVLRIYGACSPTFSWKILHLRVNKNCPSMMLLQISLQFGRPCASCCLWIRYGHTFFTLSCHSHSTDMCYRCLFFISNVPLYVSALLVTKNISFRSLFYWVTVQIVLVSYRSIYSKKLEQQ